MKKLNLAALALTALLGVLLAAYYLLSPSYGAARSARALYDARDFERALAAANEVSAKNPYNIMAYSVAEQAKKAIKRKRFSDDLREYIKRMRVFSAIERFSKADLIEIKMIIEAVEYDRARLGEGATIWDQELVREADGYYEEFTFIRDRIAKNIKR